MRTVYKISKCTHTQSHKFLDKLPLIVSYLSVYDKELEEDITCNASGHFEKLLLDLQKVAPILFHKVTGT